jgi:Amino acid synthesis
MSEISIRKSQLIVDKIWHDGGPALKQPRPRGAILTVIKNPFAGRYVEDIQPFMKPLEQLGVGMARELAEALGGPKAVQSYGKAAIVGLDGELEHGALWHAPGGYSMREVLGGTKAIVPSTKKVGPAGARIDVPLHHINAAYVRSHFDTIEVGINDAPKADEIIYILAMGTGARVHDRAGGLKASEIKGEDGQR